MSVRASPCPGDNTIARYLDRALDAGTEGAIREHLDDCDGCRRILADAGRAAERLDEDPVSRVEVLVPGFVIAKKYELVRLLGSGGMGKVFAARHVGLQQHVAVKVMHPESIVDADSMKRFLREARSAVKLRSDHAIRIHDVDNLPSGLPYLVMELLDGEDLEALLMKRKLGVDECVDYVAQAAEALSEAHEIGLVHRDLKPQNLFLARVGGGRDRVKVLDFGLAKELRRVDGGASALTAENVMLGSPFFMSPEQARAPKDVDARSDIWSLGATLYRLLTRKPPFESGTVQGVLARIFADPAPSVRELRPDVPVHVDAAIKRALEKSPDARFRDVSAFVAALRERDALPPTRVSTLDVMRIPKTRRDGAPPTDIDPAPPVTELGVKDTVPLLRAAPVKGHASGRGAHTGRVGLVLTAAAAVGLLAVIAVVALAFVIKSSRRTTASMPNSTSASASGPPAIRTAIVSDAPVTPASTAPIASSPSATSPASSGSAPSPAVRTPSRGASSGPRPAGSTKAADPDDPYSWH